jgi:hypothetical protein
MAETVKRLSSQTLTVTLGQTLVYTVPSGKHCCIGNIHLATSNGSFRFSIWMVPSGETVAQRWKIIHNQMVMGPHSEFTLPESGGLYSAQSGNAWCSKDGWTLSEGDKVYVQIDYSDFDNDQLVYFNIFGVEADGTEGKPKLLTLVDESPTGVTRFYEDVALATGGCVPYHVPENKKALINTISICNTSVYDLFLSLYFHPAAYAPEALLMPLETGSGTLYQNIGFPSGATFIHHTPLVLESQEPLVVYLYCVDPRFGPDVNNPVNIHVFGKEIDA